MFIFSLFIFTSNTLKTKIKTKNPPLPLYQQSCVFWVYMLQTWINRRGFYSRTMVNNTKERVSCLGFTPLPLHPIKGSSPWVERLPRSQPVLCFCLKRLSWLRQLHRPSLSPVVCVLIMIEAEVVVADVNDCPYVYNTSALTYCALLHRSSWGQNIRTKEDTNLQLTFILQDFCCLYYNKLQQGLLGSWGE